MENIVEVPQNVTQLPNHTAIHVKTSSPDSLFCGVLWFTFVGIFKIYFIMNICVETSYFFFFTEYIC